MGQDQVPVAEAAASVAPVDVDVAIVVVTFNSAPVLPGLLSSIPDGLEGLSWSLVVADNASVDGCADLATRALPGCSVVDLGRNAGYAAAFNAGVAAAPAHRAVLLLNPDVRLGKGSVALLLGALAEPGVGITVPRLLDGQGRLHYSLRRTPTVLRALGDALIGATRAGRWRLLGETITDPRAYDAPQLVDWAEGSTQLISSTCWRRVGPWDEHYFLYSEETEFALRARDLGLRTRYVPEAMATHLQGDSRVSPSLWRLLVGNRVRLYRRRHGHVSAALFWAVVTAREATRALLGRATNRAALAMLMSPRQLRERPGPHSLAR